MQAITTHLTSFAACETVRSRSAFPRTGKQDRDAAVISVQRDQAARIEGHAGRQAADLSPVPSTSSAQARSLPDSAPPVPAAPRRAERPTRDVVQGDADGMLHESRYARRCSRRYEGTDPVELRLIERIPWSSST